MPAGWIFLALKVFGQEKFRFEIFKTEKFSD